tara:strand:- start:362 stop:973 length:612 start_codon:yes stop_codon:yes gene_type:complete
MSKYKNIIIIILAFVTFGFAYKSNESKKAIFRAQQDLNESNQAYEINEAQLASLKDENEGLKELIDEYKEVESVTKVITKTVIDTVRIEYDNSILVSDSGTFVGSVNIDSLFYSLSCTFTEKNFTLNRIEIPNESSIVIGDRKIRGFLGIPKGREYAIDIVNSNPYVQTTNIQTYKIVQEKKWWDTKAFSIGVGFIGGFVLAR